MSHQICKRVFLRVVSMLAAAAVTLAVMILTTFLVSSVKAPTGDITPTVYPMLSGR